MLFENNDLEWRRFDAGPVPSATCPRESVLPIRPQPDFLVVFGGYADGAVHRHQRGMTEISLFGAVFSEPHDCAEMVQSLYHDELASFFRSAT